MTEDVLHSIDGFIAEIVLNRPQKLNAVTPAMAAHIEALCAAFDKDDAVRVVLLRGSAERAFCAGSDLNSLAEYPSAWKFRNRVEYATSVRNLRKPVVAALRGWVGGGGASQMLPRLVGYGQAMRLLLTGDPIEAEEAFRLGLVEYLVEDAEVEAKARALCAQLAGFSPVAVEAVKASVRTALSSALPAGLAYENEMNTLCFAAGDHMEGIKAFREKREASFSR